MIELTETEYAELRKNEDKVYQLQDEVASLKVELEEANEALHQYQQTAAVTKGQGALGDPVAAIEAAHRASINNKAA